MARIVQGPAWYRTSVKQAWIKEQVVPRGKILISTRMPNQESRKQDLEANIFSIAILYLYYEILFLMRLGMYLIDSLNYII